MISQEKIKEYNETGIKAGFALYLVILFGIISSVLFLAGLLIIVLLFTPPWWTSLVGTLMIIMIVFVFIASPVAPIIAFIFFLRYDRKHKRLRKEIKRGRKTSS